MGRDGLAAVQHRRLVKRRRVSPTAIGRTPPEGFSRAVRGGAVIIEGREGLGRGWVRPEVSVCPAQVGALPGPLQEAVDDHHNDHDQHPVSVDNGQTEKNTRRHR